MKLTGLRELIGIGLMFIIYSILEIITNWNGFREGILKKTMKETVIVC